MPIDLVGWDDAVSGNEDFAGADDDLAISGADDDLKSLLAVSGEDDLVMSGLAPRRRRRARKVTARRFPLGFVPTGGAQPGTIQTGSPVTIISNPQVPFRGERLIIPSDIAGAFNVIDIKVGNTSQFVAAGAIPALVFSEQGFGVALRMDAASVSQDIALVVQNISATTFMRFSAALLGTAMT